MRPPPRPGPAIVAEFYRGDDHITGDGRSPTAEVICDYDNLTALPSRVAHDLLGDETQRAPGYNYVLIMLGAGLRHSNGHIATGDYPPNFRAPATSWLSAAWPTR